MRKKEVCPTVHGNKLLEEYLSVRKDQVCTNRGFTQYLKAQGNSVNIQVGGNIIQSGNVIGGDLIGGNKIEVTYPETQSVWSLLKKLILKTLRIPFNVPRYVRSLSGYLRGVLK